MFIYFCKLVDYQWIKNKLFNFHIALFSICIVPENSLGEVSTVASEIIEIFINFNYIYLDAHLSSLPIVSIYNKVKAFLI